MYGPGQGPHQTIANSAVLFVNAPKQSNSGMVIGKSPYWLELGEPPVGRPESSFAHSYTGLVFAVWLFYIIKITDSTSSHLVYNIVQFEISINLELMVLLLYYVFLPMKAANSSSAMSWSIHAMPWLHNMQGQELLILCWCSFSWWGNVYVMQCFSSKGRHYSVYQLLPESDI
jgi:hypothetical protein